MQFIDLIIVILVVQFFPSFFDLPTQKAIYIFVFVIVIEPDDELFNLILY